MAVAVDSAREVLAQNWVDSPGYTRPTGDGLYPHQWNWDSAFAALGWAVVDPARAYRELRSLTGAQGRDGCIPHIAFSPQPQHYFPSADWWPARTSHDGRRISAISQPPVAATCLRLLFDRHPDEGAARELLAPLVRWHAWWLADRDPDRLGEPTVIHPWESGRDNAPDWDRPMNRLPELDVAALRQDTRWVGIDHRPSHKDYARYAWLVRAIGKAHSPQTGLARYGPFRVLDPGTSSILAAACADLAHLATDLGETRVAELSFAHADKVERALRHRANADGIAPAVDLVDGEAVQAYGAGAALNLLRARLPAAAVDALERLTTEDADALAAPTGVRSWPKCDGAAYRPDSYWRGPTWASITWLCALGLERHGRDDAAATLRARMVDAARTEGEREYCDGDTGEGLGTHNFTWTAALTLWSS